MRLETGIWKVKDILINWELMKTVTIEWRKIKTHPVPNEQRFCGVETCITSGHLLLCSFGPVHSGMTVSLYTYYWQNKAPVWLCARGMWWRSWLRHCATSWKVAGSIPDGENGIFHLYNPSGHTMALGSPQSPTEETRWSVVRRWWGVCSCLWRCNFTCPRIFQSDNSINLYRTKVTFAVTQVKV
jgi:hypothetical protein